MKFIIFSLVYVFAMLSLGAFVVHYDVTFWASFFKHKQVVVPWLPCYLVALVAGGPAAIVAVVTWVLSFVL